MCMQDIVLAGQLVSRVNTFTLNQNVLTKVAVSNGLRYTLTIGVTGLVSQTSTGTVTGNIDPVTGDVVEATVTTVNENYVVVGFMDGTTFIPFVKFTLDQPMIVLRYTDLGPILRGDVWAKQTSGNQPTMGVIDTYFVHEPRV